MASELNRLAENPLAQGLPDRTGGSSSIDCGSIVIRVGSKAAGNCLHRHFSVRTLTGPVPRDREAAEDAHALARDDEPKRRR